MTDHDFPIERQRTFASLLRLRIPLDARDQLERVAAAHGRTLSAEVRSALYAHLRTEDAEQTA